MESNYKDMENKKIEPNSGKIWAGLFIIGIGAIMLLRNFGLNLPNWLFGWPTLLIAIGLFVGAKHRFKNSSWIIMVMIGAYFTVERALPGYIDFHRVGLPILLVGLGVFLIFKPKDSFKQHRCKKSKKNKFQKDPFSKESDLNEDASDSFTTDKTKYNSNDFIDSVNVFGGSHQMIYSKNFKGGEVTAVFGGCDINLTQADFEGQIEIDVTAVFGGCKIVVPAGWQVRSEVTAIFGGLDDKRSIQPPVEGQNKMLVIKGVAMFGGVDIRNF